MKSKIKCHSRSVMAVVLAISMLISTMMVGLIATDAARVAEINTAGAANDDMVGATDDDPVGATQTDNVNIASTTTMLVAAMTNTNDTYYSNKYIHMWNKEFNSDEPEAICGIPAMTPANYGGVAYFQPDDSKISTKSGNYIYYQLCSDSNYTYPWECKDKTNQDNFTKGTQYMMYRTATNTDAKFGTFTPITITSISYPDSITEGESASITVSATGGFPWFYYTKLNNTYETKKYKITVTNSAGTKVVDAESFKFSDGSYTFNWIPASTTDYLTFSVSDNDSIDSVSYTKDNFTITPAENFHNVGVTIVGNGTVTANENNVTSGSNISVGENTATTLVAAPAAHYHFKNWSDLSNVSLDSAYTEASNTITASADGTITANFEEDTKYTVNAMGCTPSPASAYAGETVTLTPSVPSGKLIEQVTVLDENSQAIRYQVSGDNYTFEMPASNVTATITYRDPATINVTASSGDSAKGSAAASPSGSVTEGTPITFTATPETGKTFDKWIVTENNSTRTVTDAQFSQIAGCYNISAVAYFNDGYTVSVNIDDSTHGVVEGVSHEVAAAGQEITVTWNTKFGWTYDELWDVTNNREVTPTSYSNTEIKFNMPSESVNYQIKTKTTISTSTYKYYGYDYNTEKVNPISGYNGLAFSESYLDGDTSKKFSYIYISGRTGNNNESFSVENTAAAVDVNTIYFEDGNDWGSVKAVFFDKDWNVLQASGKKANNDNGLDMTDTQCNYSNHRVFAIAVPPTAKHINFRKDNDWATSTAIELSNSKNYYYISSGLKVKNPPSNFPNLTHHYMFNNWKNDQVSTTTNVDVYNNGKKYGSNINLSESYFQYWISGGSNAKNMKVANVDNNDHVPYYIIVYYPNTKYSDDIDLSGVNHPVIVAQTFLPGEKVDPVVVTNVKVIAKDGAVRRYGASRNPGSDQDYSTFEKHADTYLTDDTFDADPSYSTERKGYGTSQTTYDYASKVEKGSTIYFKTTVDANMRDTYYVKAFSINGVTYELLNADTTTGVYTGSFTIPTDYDRDYVEITPIYYLVDPGDTVRFSVQGYDDSVMNSGWGNTLYVYPYWEGLSKDNNGFGGYPGQPMIFYKGEYYIDIPVTYSGKTVKGMTLNNGYWDDIHYKVVGEVSKHHQTYDYDDFYKIYKEYPDLGNGESRRIICSFKFRTKKNNDKPGTVIPSNYDSTNGNGWEVLTNYEGTPVDIYGKKLNMTVEQVKQASQVVHVISQDYKQNCAGHYATEWAVYGLDNNYRRQIVPSALVINEDNIRSYINSKSTGFTKAQVEEYMKKTYGSSTAKFAEEYVALDGLRDQPAMITYEKSIWGGDDPAERCDARWYWSYTSAKVNANMRVAYSNDGGASFNLDGTDPLTEGETAPTTGATVSFGSDKSTKNHVLTNQPIDTPVALSADQNTTNYTFVGWYAIREGVAQFVGTDPSQSNIPLTSNVTFEARYVRTTKGYFTIGHLVHPASTGTGTVEISAQLKADGTAQGAALTATNGSVDFSGLTYGGKQTIEVTLSSTPTGISSFEDFYATLSDLLSGYNADYISNLVINTSGGTKTATFTITVDKLFKVVDQTNITQSITSMTNYSKFGVEDIDLNVNIVFTFPVRYYPNKNYEIKHVTITKDERLLYFPNATNITELTPAYVMSKAPYESIYRKDFEWGTPSISGLKATVAGTATVKPNVTAVVDDGSGQTTLYTAPYLGNFEEANSTTINHVNKESENLYFQQWNVYKLDEQYYTSKTPVAICFSENFNYAGFEDYYVEAVYGPTSVENRHALVSGLTTNVSLLNITRSHWNNTLNGNADSGSLYNSPNTEYDRIYVDFVLSYANEGKLVNEDSKTFGYNLTYIDGSTKKTIRKTIDNTKADEKNRVEVALGIENLRGNASPTRTYTITPTIDGSEVGSASQSFCLYEVAFPQAAWAK